MDLDDRLLRPGLARVVLIELGANDSNFSSPFCSPPKPCRPKSLPTPCLNVLCFFRPRTEPGGERRPRDLGENADDMVLPTTGKLIALTNTVVVHNNAKPLYPHGLSLVIAVDRLGQTPGGIVPGTGAGNAAVGAVLWQQGVAHVNLEDLVGGTGEWNNLQKVGTGGIVSTWVHRGDHRPWPCVEQVIRLTFKGVIDAVAAQQAETARLHEYIKHVRYGGQLAPSLKNDRFVHTFARPGAATASTAKWIASCWRRWLATWAATPATSWHCR
jgi:hypothetical protein